jgi:hypothetical protein
MPYPEYKHLLCLLPVGKMGACRYLTGESAFVHHSINASAREKLAEIYYCVGILMTWGGERSQRRRPGSARL